jgi:hypothetical protein
MLIRTGELPLYLRQRLCAARQGYFQHNMLVFYFKPECTLSKKTSAIYLEIVKVDEPSRALRESYFSERKV